EMGFPRTGRAPHHHPGVADLPRRQTLERGDCLGVRTGKEIVERRRFRRCEVEDELFAHGRGWRGRLGLTGGGPDSGKMVKRRTLPRRKSPHPLRPPPCPTSAVRTPPPPSGPASMPSRPSAPPSPLSYRD